MIRLEVCQALTDDEKFIFRGNGLSWLIDGEAQSFFVDVIAGGINYGKVEVDGVGGKLVEKKAFGEPGKSGILTAVGIQADYEEKERKKEKRSGEPLPEG